MTYKRILLKLSGEALIGPESYGIHHPTLERIASEVAAVASEGIQVAVVIGGGNIFRGVSGSARGMDRATADYMGMIATLMNGLALQDAFEKAGCIRGFKPRSKCKKWRSRISADGRFGIWKRVEWSFSRVEPEIRISRRIPRLHSGPWKSTPRSL